MTETNFRNMTIEHLGQDATQQDLDNFRSAVERLLTQPGAWNADIATDYVWNNGSIRFEADWCRYCGGIVEDRTFLPTNDVDWNALAPHHAPDCEWITTRTRTVSA